MHKVNVSLLFNQLAGMDIQRTFTFIIKPSKVNVMSLKYSNTTADFLEWDEAMNLIRKLYKDGNYNMSLLIALGCFFGLRIGDILSLRWNQILNASEFTIIEKKTGKKRTIRINPQLIILKELKKKYRLHIGNFSCHSLRKTFGRQVYNMNSENSELALVKLMELFNHSSIAITKRYLGLRQEELLNTYECLSF